MTYKGNMICLSVVFISILPSLASGSQGGPQYKVDVPTSTQTDGDNGILGQAIGVSFAVTLITIVLTVHLPFFIWYKCTYQKRRERRHRGDSSSTVPLQKQLSTTSNGSAQGCPSHVTYQPIATRETRIKHSDPYSRREIEDEVSKWCTEKGLTEETKNQLKAKGFKQKEELESLDPGDIHMLELNMAQSSLLKDLLKKKQRQDLSPSGSGNIPVSDGGNIKLMRGTSKQSSKGSMMTHKSEGVRLLDQPDGGLHSVTSDTPRFIYPSTQDTSIHTRPVSVSNISGTVPQPPCRQVSVGSSVVHSPSRPLSVSSPNSPAAGALSAQNQQHPRFHGMLSDEGLYELAAKIGHEYEQLASYLKIPRKYLEQLKMDYPNRVQDRIYNILRIYRDTAKGDKAEIKGQLHKALMRCRRTDLAEDLLKETVHCSQEKLVTSHSVV